MQINYVLETLYVFLADFIGHASSNILYYMLTWLTATIILLEIAPRTNLWAANSD